MTNKNKYLSILFIVLAISVAIFSMYKFNMAEEFIDGTGYEYNVRGLSSNNDSEIYPTKTNIIKIINDAQNRSTLP